METEITINDFKYFLKENIKLITTITILFTLIGVLFTGYQEFSRSTSSPKQETMEEQKMIEMEIQELMEMNPDELTDNQLEAVSEFLSEGTYFFRIFVENPDYSTFTRHQLLYEAMLTEDAINAVEEITEREFNLNPEYLVHLNYNSDNSLNTVYFTTGNAADSRQLAEAYFSLMTENELEILQGRRVYIFNEPNLAETDEVGSEDVSVVPSEGTSRNLIVSILLTVIIATIFGVLFGIIIAAIISKFKKKIGYLYSYHLNPQDVLINISQGSTRGQELSHAVLQTVSADKILLHENVEGIENDVLNAIRELEKEVTGEIRYVTNVLEIDPEARLNEVLILIHVGETTKDWYEKQVNYLKGYQVSKRVIKIN